MEKESRRIHHSGSCIWGTIFGWKIYLEALEKMKDLWELVGGVQSY